MMKLIFLALAITALIYFAQADCSCSWCSSHDGKLPDTCLTEGCTAQFLLTNLTAIDPYTGLICATNKCFVGGSCPSYSQSGSVLASSPLADEYAGAFASSIGTACLEDVCWYNQTLTCPPGSCSVDVRLVNITFGVWCATLAIGKRCPSGFKRTETMVVPRYQPTPEQLEEVVGACAQYVGCNNLSNLCGLELHVPSLDIR